jgi:imidazolonepropionase-like amidohydrolase
VQAEKPPKVAAPALPPIPDAPWRGDGARPSDHPKSIDAAPTVVLRGARLLIGDGREIDNGHVVLVAGRIAAVGSGPGEAPAGAVVIDASGKTITPGLIDTHSHMGVYAMPSSFAHGDGNEMTQNTTAGVRTRDAIWPFDPAFQRALQGGTTTVQVLPGSGNLIGGRATTIKLRPAKTSRELEFAGAPTGLKMACGENPKRVYGRERKSTPMTRMGNLEQQRNAFLKAKKLIAQWANWRESERLRQKKWLEGWEQAEREIAERETRRKDCDAGKQPPDRCRAWREAWQKQPARLPDPLEPTLPPDRDLAGETLAGAIEGSVLVHVHCYRSDDIDDMLSVADEMGFKVRSFHHALEAYKVKDELAKRKIGVSTWADWYGFKLEAYDGIPENLALIHKSGGIAIVHTDSSEGVRRMNQEAAKGMWAGRHSGIDIKEAEAIRWVTMNPAWALGIDSWVGSLEVGKDADLVVWDQSPFSVYARAERVFVDGIELHDVRRPAAPWSDFEVQP